jgi:hypothetical protein
LDSLAPKTQLGSGQLVVYLQALDVNQRMDALQDKLAELVADVMGMSAASIPMDKSFFELGMDSLMAVELRNRLQVQVGADKPVHSTIIFDYPSIFILSQHLAETNLRKTMPNSNFKVELDFDQNEINEMDKADILQMAQNALNLKRDSKDD